MRPRKWQYLATLSLFFLFSSTIVSANMITQSWRPVVTLSGGALFNADAGKSSNFPANQQIFSFYNYSAHQIDQTVGVWGGFVGVEFFVLPQWNVQTGIGYYQPSALNVKGHVNQGVDTFSADQYAYQFDIQTRQLLVESKLLYCWNQYHPYLLAGIGASWNTSQNYNVFIQPPFTTVSNQFQNHTVTSFTYNVGVGVDMNVADNIRLGIGYRFADLGSAKTGLSYIGSVATSHVLSQSNLYSNELIVQFTAILM